MQPHRSGKTDRLSHKALQPCSKYEMVSFNLLRMYLANSMLFGIEMTIVHVCTIGIEMPNAQRCS